MGGPFTFLAALGSFLASGAMYLKEDADREAKNREWRSHKYSWYIQEEYDNDYSRLFRIYDLDKMQAAIQADYPRMSSTWVYMIAQTAAAKRLMEEETEWEYKIPEKLVNANIDVDKYSTDEFKWIENNPYY